ncbi:MAG: hypothetical protein F6K30_08775 [Cyanothece sp. SIO2G6]|nr:hypothetical protein [Cyanothece sp. SIO2G6]
MSNNSGSIINGDISGSTVGVTGQNGSIQQTIYHTHDSEAVSKIDDVKKAIDNLTQEIQKNKATIPEHEEVIKTVETIGKEVEAESPNKYTLMGLLEGVTKGVGSAAGTVNSISSLKTAIAALLGIAAI